VAKLKKRAFLHTTRLAIFGGALAGAIALGAATGFLVAKNRKAAAPTNLTRSTGRLQVSPSTHPEPHRPNRANPAWLSRARLSRETALIAHDRASEVGVEVRELASGSSFKTGRLQVGLAWSTIKVPIVMARFRLAEAHRERDVDSIAALAQRAITASDNAAAAELFGQIESTIGGLTLGSRYVESELRQAADRTTSINTINPGGGFSTYGQTLWTLSNGTLFYRALARGCLEPRDKTSDVLRWMQQVESDQRWGIPTATWTGASTVGIKGGWGPDSHGRYLVRQFGVIEDSDRRGFVVALIARPIDGSFTSGIAVLDELAKAVAASTDVTRTRMFRPCALTG
jgi:hypothetical protein